MAEKFKFLVGTKALVQNSEGNFLLLRRSETAPSFPGYWDLPGGLIDETDEPELAITREITEEAGLAVRGVEILGLTKFMRKDDLTICILFTASAIDPEQFVLSDEHSEYKWVGYEAIEQMEIQPWLKELVLRKISE